MAHIKKLVLYTKMVRIRKTMSVIEGKTNHFRNKKYPKTEARITKIG